MRDAGVKQAVLVGHSMGGNEAVTFAGLYPRKAAGIVYVGGFMTEQPEKFHAALSEFLDRK